MRRSCAALAACFGVACGGEPDVAPAPRPDAGAPIADAAPDATPADAGADVRDGDSFFAPAPRLPLMDYLGGALLTKVKVVTITFANDDPQVVGRMNLFGDTAATTQWWKAALSEYCVLPAGTPCIGPGNTSVHVALAQAAPASVLDANDPTKSDVAKLLQSNIDSAVLPQPTEQTLYMLYYPAGTSIEFEGMKSCQSYGAYHYSVELVPKGGGAHVEAAYAIMPRCSGEPFLTVAASHELMEAATDAHPSKDRGWVMQDNAFPLLGGEDGDLCDHPWGSVFDTTTEATFALQRGWSNAAARAGHDPCVPEQATPWFMAGPSNQEIALAVGESAKLEVWGFADAPLADWALSVEDRSGGALALALDKQTIGTGGRATLTLTLKSKPKGGVAFYGVDSKVDTREMRWGASVRAK